MGAIPQARDNDAKVAEEQIRCYELRLTGMSIRNIAKATGLSVGCVHNRIQAEIRQRVLPLAEEVRQMELDRLDRWLTKLDAQIQQNQSVARNVEVAVKVAERRARLLGIDAPERIDATVHEVSQEDVALAELIREEQAKAALVEQQMRERTA